MTTVVLISAVFASLAGGVLLAYAVCIGMFQIFRMHSIQVAQQRVQKLSAQALASVDLIAS